MDTKNKILFLCTGNSCRSQMAEAWVRVLKPDTMEAFSAGVKIHGINPDAIKVMAEAGVDISAQRSKHVNEFLNTDFDAIITLCDHARHTCPYFPGKSMHIHAGFDDPPALAHELAKKRADREQQLDCYRRVRDEIKRYVNSLDEVLDQKKSWPDPEKPAP